MPRTASLAALLVALAGPALADPAETPPAQPKSIETAWLLSGLTTAAGVALIYGADQAANRNNRDGADAMLLPGVAAVIAGPSVGHWYAGAIVTPGLVVRALAVTGMAYHLTRCDCSSEERTDTLLAAGAVWAAGAVYDLATLDSRVRARNARDLAVSPYATPDQVGVAVTGGW